MSLLRYIELKSGFHDNGPAWIGRVTLSRSKTTVYFNGRALKKIKRGGISSNYRDIESGESFWISGIKKNGEDRHWAGSGRVLIEAAAVEEYLATRNLSTLDRTRYEITMQSSKLILRSSRILKTAAVATRMSKKTHNHGFESDARPALRAVFCAPQPKS